jgi:hypothetical protein
MLDTYPDLSLPSHRVVLAGHAAQEHSALRRSERPHRQNGSQWSEAEQKPHIKAVKAILDKVGYSRPVARIEIMHPGKTNFCYPAEVCLAVPEYYAFDAGANCQPQARDNFRILAGSKLRRVETSRDDL